MLRNYHLQIAIILDYFLFGDNVGAPVIGTQSLACLNPRLLHMAQITQPLRVFVSIKSENFINNIALFIAKPCWIPCKKTWRDFEATSVQSVKTWNNWPICPRFNSFAKQFTLRPHN